MKIIIQIQIYLFNVFKKSQGTIKFEIDELIGVHSCDIIFEDSLNEEIKKQINNYGITIYSYE